MAGWLAAAEKLFRGEPSQSLPPFELTCACGRTVTGQRTKAMQTPHCPVCGVSLFVLPASVYPPPKSPKRKAVAAPAPAPKPPADAEPDKAEDADQLAGLPPKVGKKAAAARDERTNRLPPKSGSLHRRRRAA